MSDSVAVGVGGGGGGARGAVGVDNGGVQLVLPGDGEGVEYAIDHQLISMGYHSE